MKITSGKVKKIILGALLKSAGDLKTCKNEIKLSALSIIDNREVVLDNEHWIKYLTNFEQQKFYDDEYYKITMDKWNTRRDINISECINYKFFYLRNVKDKVWYEEAKRIYMDGYLIFPLSKPILPNMKSIDNMYDSEYLENKIAYFPIGEYIKCIDEKNGDKCEKKSKLGTVKGVTIEVLAIAGIFITGKFMLKCFLKTIAYCVDRSFGEIGGGIARAWARDEVRLNRDDQIRNNDNNYNEDSIETVIDEDASSLEWLGLEDEETSGKSNITLTMGNSKCIEQSSDDSIYGDSEWEEEAIELNIIDHEIINQVDGRGM